MIKKTTKYNLGGNNDHLQSFYLEIEGLRAREYEDVFCRLFPHTLKGAATSWYFGFPASSIPDWDTFERIFRSNYATQKNHAALMKGLCTLKKERKEKVHSFTQRFVAYLKNFSETDKPSDKVLIEYYTSSLGPDLAMFAKMKSKPTLVETYEEVERVEAERESVEDYPDLPREKTPNRRALLLSKPVDEQSHEYQRMMTMLQKLSNRIIDLEREKEVQKTYKPCYPKREDNNQ